MYNSNLVARVYNEERGRVSVTAVSRGLDLYNSLWYITVYMR